MSEKNLTVPLRQMRIAAEELGHFTDGMEYKQFLMGRPHTEAVAMDLLLIGEAATNLERFFSDFTRAHPEIPWTVIRGMRNRIAHSYDPMALQVIWESVQDEVPVLLQRLQEIDEPSQ